MYEVRIFLYSLLNSTQFLVFLKTSQMHEIKQLILDIFRIIFNSVLLYNFPSITQRSRYSDWLRADRPKGRSRGRVKNFLFSTSSRRALYGSAQPPIQWVPRNFSPGVRRSGRETGHSPPANVENKEMWIYTYTAPYAFME
jgi:hypothetical protein